MKEKYYYNGPVTSFGQCLTDRWRGETYAESEKKARSNLIYTYKIRHNLSPGAKIELPGICKKEANYEGRAKLSI